MSICALTPPRLAWLRYLAKHGTTRWERMPKNKAGWSCSNRVWIPMQDAGWITSECHAPRGGMDPFDHYFTITDEGRGEIVCADQVEL